MLLDPHSGAQHSRLWIAIGDLIRKQAAKTCTGEAHVIAPAALFLAAKVEEQPRKLEHVIKVAHACLYPQDPPLDTKSDTYLQQAQDLVMNEHIMLQTLGFEITIDHPHTDVVKCTQLVRASKDLAQTSYFMATNSLHLTTFCLQYKPTVVACVCIHLACKWSNWEIPVSSDGKHWWEYVDNSVTMELLDALTHEFLQILEKTPNRLKRIRNWKAYQNQFNKKSKLDGTPSLETSAHSHDNTFNLDISNFSPTEKPTVLGLGPLAHTSGGSAPSSQPLCLPASGQLVTTLKGYSFPKLHDPSGKTETSKGERTHLDTSQVYRADGPSKLLAREVAQGTPAPATLNRVPYQKVSLSEYQEKNAVALAEQKRRLERQEAEQKEKYASDAQKLLEQYRRERDRQAVAATASSTEALHKSKHKSHHQGSERPDKHTKEKSSLKVRLPVMQEEPTKDGREIKVKIKVPPPHHDHHTTEDGSRGRHLGVSNKEKHKEHHPSHHHHHHYSSSGSGGSSGSSHKHSSSHLHSSGKHANEGSTRASSALSTEVKSTSRPTGSGSGSTRVRPRENDVSPHCSAKVSKLSAGSSASGGKSTAGAKHNFNFQSLLNLPMPPPPPTGPSSTGSTTYGQIPRLKAQKDGSGESNGLGSESGPDLDSVGSGHRDNFKATRDMLQSLLSAQGVSTPTSTNQSAFPSSDFPSGFPFGHCPPHSYQSVMHRAQTALSGSGPTLPPLPSEPPPPPPPLPK
uniref:Cyclin N-terminal domain-containing protein n=1 Tax=Eptatretus burgeri TaxID=7764 RepID=A0A8C4R8V7_EPTBU